jgi:hypothetical protein
LEKLEETAAACSPRETTHGEGKGSISRFQKKSQTGWDGQKWKVKKNAPSMVSAGPGRIGLPFPSSTARQHRRPGTKTQPNPTQSPFFFFFTFLHTNLII